MKKLDYINMKLAAKFNGYKVDLEVIKSMLKYLFELQCDMFSESGRVDLGLVYLKHRVLADKKQYKVTCVKSDRLKAMLEQKQYDMFGG
jgi:hypothetical protein